jgi:homoserine dehydrogenase
MSAIGIAMLGFGNVGRSFAKYLSHAGGSAFPPMKIGGVADASGAALFAADRELNAILHSGKTVAQQYPDRDLLDVPSFILGLRKHGISVLVECMPTNIRDGQPAITFLRAALVEKLHVVTVDKGPIVHGWTELSEAARRSGVRLLISGTTGVRPPESLNGKRIVQIQGVLNGTTNYVLTEMLHNSLDFRHALHRAQELGIAEPDPSLDIEGWDTACKVLILANTCMSAGATLADVYRTGIGPETASLIESARGIRGRVHLIGSSRFYQNRARVQVAPKIVDSDSPFFHVSGSAKLAIFTTEDGAGVAVPAQSGRDAIARLIAEDVVHAATGFPHASQA